MFLRSILSFSRGGDLLVFRSLTFTFGGRLLDGTRFGGDGTLLFGTTDVCEVLGGSRTAKKFSVSKKPLTRDFFFFFGDGDLSGLTTLVFPDFTVELLVLGLILFYLMS